MAYLLNSFQWQLTTYFVYDIRSTESRSAWQQLYYFKKKQIHLFDARTLFERLTVHFLDQIFVTQRLTSYHLYFLGENTPSH